MNQDILILFIGAMLGFFGQVLWRQYEKRSQRQERPELVVTKVVKGGNVFAELHNVGADNLSELELKISWLQDGVQQERTLKNFYRTDDDPVIAGASTVEYLASGERIRAADLPTWTDDGIVAVTVEGLGVKSGKLFTHVSELTVGLRK